MRLRRLIAGVIICATVASLPLPALAAASTTPNHNEHGLLITPLQHEIKSDAGKTTDTSLVVANLTDRQITVNLAVEQFSVTDYTYDYRFTNPHTDWVKMGTPQLLLASGQSRTIPYSITPDAGAAPGGYYYTLIASSKLSQGGLPSTVQAASLIYVTVNGKLIQTGQVSTMHVGRFIFGRQIDYTMDALNTGNVYYTALTTSGERGLFFKRSGTPSTHLLIPHKVRRLEGTIRSPVLPGVYRLVLGYTPESGATVSRATWFIYLPPWFLALVLAVLLFSRTIWRWLLRAVHTRTTKKSD